MMEAVLKKGPWNVCKAHLNLLIYDDSILLEDCQFIHQDWTVQFKNLLLEHHSVQVIDESLVELGPKIWTEPPNCMPSYGSMITARVKVDLKKPLFRGGWWNTRAGGVPWVRYHWERQPHNLCPKCLTIFHEKEECSNMELDLKIRRYTNEEYVNYCHELARAYGVEIYEDLDILLERICEANRKKLDEESMEQEDTRRTKRLRNSEDEPDETSITNQDLALQGQEIPKTIIEQNTGNNSSNTEFDGVEHDLIDEGEGK